MTVNYARNGQLGRNLASFQNGHKYRRKPEKKKKVKKRKTTVKCVLR